VNSWRDYSEEFLPLLNPKTRTISPTLVTRLFHGWNRTDQELEFSSRQEASLAHPYTLLEAFCFKGGAPGQFVYAQGSVDLAGVACALERFRIANGNYPQALDAVTPRFIDVLPHDLINGQPLHYRLTDPGHFVLYSIGWANKDDGGKVHQSIIPLNDVRNGNWVWRYP
jgi:hypothetical protein